MIAVLRIRGIRGTSKQIHDALKLLRLTRKNHCTLLGNASQGVLRKISGYAAWGEAGEQTIELLLEKRGELDGGKHLTNEYLEKNTRFKSVKELAKELSEGKASLNEVPALKQVFRLAPPIKGFKPIKLAYPRGSLGNLGDKINELIQRMA